MQTIRVAEHLDRTEKVERPDWWHSNDKNTTRAPRDGTRMIHRYVFRYVWLAGAWLQEEWTKVRETTIHHKPCLAASQRLPDPDPTVRIRQNRHHQCLFTNGIDLHRRFR